MICYICEKKINTGFLSLSFNRDYYAENVIQHVLTEDKEKALGFHVECLKDSLGEDFYRFFKEREDIKNDKNI